MLEDLSHDTMSSAALTGLLSLSGRDLLRLVAIDDAIAVVDAAMRMLSNGSVESPERWAMPVGDHGRMGLMPGASVKLGRFGVKVIGLFPPSRRGDLPSHQGVMLLFDIADGKPLCTVDGHALTSLRTAAASAVATRILANPDAETLAIIGCGEQAPLHIEAIAGIRPIRQVRLWNRTRARAELLAQDERHRERFEFVVVDNVEDAIRGAGIICTLTAASEPVLLGRHLEPGQHLNIVGSSLNGPREIDDDAVSRSRYFADSREHALSQGAELVHAMRAGRVCADHLLGEIGDVLEGHIPGRTATGDITLYKSLGHIAQDLAVADFAHRRWAAASRP